MGYGYTNVSATTAAVANRFVASTNMIVGTYTVANPSPVWAGACLVTVTHTTGDRYRHARHHRHRRDRHQ